MSTVPKDKMSPPLHQPDPGGQKQPVTGLGKVDHRPPTLGIGPSKAKPVLGKK